MVKRDREEGEEAAAPDKNAAKKELEEMSKEAQSAVSKKDQ